MSVYIKVFFEEEYMNLGWESFQTYKDYLIYDHKNRKKLTHLIGRTGSIHLGILSTLFYCIHMLSKSYSAGKFNIQVEDLCLLVISIVLVIIIVIINKEYYKNHEMELEPIIRKYKQKRKTLPVTKATQR